MDVVLGGHIMTAKDNLDVVSHVTDTALDSKMLIHYTFVYLHCIGNISLTFSLYTSFVD